MNDVNKLYQVLHALRFYASPEHPCSYLADHIATTMFVDPTAAVSSSDYSLLSSIGFRRSGEHIYRPHCTDCYACVPTRIPVKNFKPNRTQRRTLKKNQSLQFSEREAEFNADHFDLYQRYMHARHRGGGMDSDDPAAYMRILTSSWADTRVFELRNESRLLAVAIVDVLLDGLSAVYTFFEPEMASRSLGSYMILLQIEKAKALSLPFVYLGYWNEQSPKMAYKIDYRPIELYDGRQWTRLD